jgi:hypothetical protein
MKMENNCIVYRHIRLDKNEPFYIGIAKNPKRPYIKNQRNNLWHKIVDKTEYRVDILFDDLTYEQACEKEKEFIQLYGRINLGTGTLVNMTDGGDTTHGYKHSDKTKEKISKKRFEHFNKNGRKKEWNTCQSYKQDSLRNDNVANGKRKNSSGKGIVMNKAGKYIASITIYYKRIYLGIFNTREEALTARLEAEKKYWNNNA